MKKNASGSYRRRLFHCQWGPEDCSRMEVREAAAASAKVKQEAAEAAEASADGVSQPRSSKVAEGRSFKVGCKCHFEVREYDREPETMTIRYHEPNHTQHEARFAPYVSEETKLWVRLMLLASDGKISTAEIINQNQSTYLNPILCVTTSHLSVQRGVLSALRAVRISSSCCDVGGRLAGVAPSCSARPC